MNPNRRDFLKKSSMAGAGLAILPSFLNATNFTSSATFGATYMGDFAAPKLETVFLLTSAEFGYISSSIVRDVYKNGGDYSLFVPKQVRIK